jgi:hypothetical protein
MGLQNEGTHAYRDGSHGEEGAPTDHLGVHDAGLKKWENFNHMRVSSKVILQSHPWFRFFHGIVNIDNLALFVGIILGSVNGNAHYFLR